MDIADPILLANVLYLMLVAGVWLAALALATPGTGVLEALALLALSGGAVGVLTLPVHPWALAVLAVGGVMFVLSVRGRRPEAWLVGAGVAISLGSTFLFRREGGGAAVHPVLAILVSAGTLGFFWLVVRKAAAALRARPVFDPAAVVGQEGEVRTALEPTGSVFAGGELWSAWSPRPVAVGRRVRVTGVNGLILEVEPIASTDAKEA
jgi:membrane-bound serine protease (ClpP class)